MKNQVFTGGVYWILNQKLIFFFRFFWFIWTKALHRAGWQTNSQTNTAWSRKNDKNGQQNHPLQDTF